MLRCFSHFFFLCREDPMEEGPWRDQVSLSPSPLSLLVPQLPCFLTSTDLCFHMPTSTISFQGLCLVDWGRGIDISLFPAGTEFNGDCQTSCFRCIEMQEKRTWTYQVSLNHRTLWNKYNIAQLVWNFPKWNSVLLHVSILKTSQVVSQYLNICSDIQSLLNYSFFLNALFEKRQSWSRWFQVDTYGLCASVYMMLHGQYMSVEKKATSDGSHYYQPKAPFKRYFLSSFYQIIVVPYHQL